MRERFRAFVPHLDTVERECARDLFEKAGLFAHRLDEREAGSGKHQTQGDTWESGTATDVDDPLAAAPFAHSDGGERVQEMFGRNVGRRCDRSEVRRRIAFDEEIGIPLAARDRRGVETDADALGVASERRERRVSGLRGRHGP